MAARQLPLWSAAIFSIFLSSLCLCFCFWLSFFRSFPVVLFFLAIFHATCANFLRDGAWMMQRARGAGAGFVFMFRKSKFRYLQIAGQASLFPLTVLWPTFRFSLSQSAQFFYVKGFQFVANFLWFDKLQVADNETRDKFCVIF